MKRVTLLLVAFLLAAPVLAEGHTGAPGISVLVTNSDHEVPDREGGAATEVGAYVVAGRATTLGVAIDPWNASRAGSVALALEGPATVTPSTLTFSTDRMVFHDVVVDASGASPGAEVDLNVTVDPADGDAEAARYPLVVLPPVSIEAITVATANGTAPGFPDADATVTVHVRHLADWSGVGLAVGVAADGSAWSGSLGTIESGEAGGWTNLTSTIGTLAGLAGEGVDGARVHATLALGGDTVRGVALEDEGDGATLTFRGVPAAVLPRPNLVAVDATEVVPGEPSVLRVLVSPDATTLAEATVGVEVNPFRATRFTPRPAATAEATVVLDDGPGVVEVAWTPTATGRYSVDVVVAGSERPYPYRLDVALAPTVVWHPAPYVSARVPVGESFTFPFLLNASDAVDAPVELAFFTLGSGSDGFTWWITADDLVEVDVDPERVTLGAGEQRWLNLTLTPRAAEEVNVWPALLVDGVAHLAEAAEPGPPDHEAAAPWLGSLLDADARRWYSSGFPGYVTITAVASAPVAGAVWALAGAAAVAVAVPLWIQSRHKP